jgi:hypothetical protein
LKITPEEVEAAKSTLVHKAATEEASTSSAAQSSFKNQALLNISRDYHMKIMEQAQVKLLLLVIFLCHFVNILICI